MSEHVTIAGDFITLDLLLTRKFGFAGQKLLQQTLDLNPGLAGLGEFIPHKTVVTLPDEVNQEEEPLTPEPNYSLFGD